MTWSAGPYFRLRKSHRTLIYGCIAIIVLLGLAWNYSSTKFSRRASSSRSSFDVFDVHGLFPGQRVLSGQTPDNVLGLSRREVKLVNRVKDVEDENRRLKYQLSVSQNQLISILGEQQRNEGGGGETKKKTSSLEDEEDGAGGGEEPCEHTVKQCEEIQICMVVAGSNSTRIAVTLLKSILFYRRHPIHFHFMTDESTMRVLDTLFATWLLPQVQVHFYLSDNVVKDVDWIPNKHYSGIYGLLKLTLPKVLPESLEKVIVLDTDLILATDISKLWVLFSEFQNQEALGLVENQSDWYIPGKLWKSHSPWPALGRGFNTGVILMDLVKLRAKNWSQLWRLVAEKDLVTMYGTSLADQDIFNGLLKQHPSLLHRLPCQWNLQLSDNTRSEQICSAGIHDLKIIHFNSPKKLDVKNRNVEYFRNHYITFIQYDANLLRRELFDCNTTKTMTSPTKSITEELDKHLVKEDNVDCYELERAKKRIYRTHPFFLDFEDDDADAKNDEAENEITLVAQLSMDRLHMVESLCNQWHGPLSLALYLSDAEADQLVKFVQSSPILNKRKNNVSYHVVFKEGDFYPINYLRNVALRFANTSHVFLSDIDFLPSQDALRLLKKATHQLLGNPDEEDTASPRALIVPAFETKKYRLDDFPRTKADVIRLLDEGNLVTFRFNEWPRGHETTNFAKWRTATTPYKVQWEPDFEPYIVLPKSQAIEYDQRFVGFGWNKVSHIMELAFRSTEFVVLPNVFIVHIPHAPSLDIAKYS